ncbi:hypothetical protein CKM354_001298200 [Cercospora kikuchii]|uniref:DUF7580 domain-containing protein n=1 Tax=Cercospora kikuchii TaxID=84275 RepID=A0A9P3FN04_9PEZI|nr:uncharacterized protein CKM354_001298200 [Cercospora kikuchii]GIZ49966.1 hypothetical protein CKM354_001298200 [Cercospora kikuchii]
MDNEPLFSLVEDVINVLYVAALSLNNEYQRVARHRKANKVLGRLICELYILNSNLSEFHTNGRALSKHLQGLAQCLLQLCAWRHHKPDRISSLKDVVEQGNQKAVKYALISFVDASSDAQAALFAKLEGSLNFAASDASAREEVKLHDSLLQESKFSSSNEYASHVHDTLYNVLWKHLRCRCGPSPWAHRGGLRLTKDAYIESGMVHFETVFSAAQDPCPMTWRAFRFEVPSRTSRAIRIDVGDGGPQYGLTTSDGSRPISAICDVYAYEENNGPVAYRLKADGGSLAVLPDTYVSDQEVAQRPCKNLSELCQSMELSSIDKVTLICILAESALRYYDSSLVKMRSIVERIHFLPEGTDSSESLFRPIRPYITIDRDTFESEQEKEFLDGFGLPHRFPKILALGVVMVQICEGSFDQTNLSYEGRTITNYLLQAKRLLRSEHWPTLDFVNGQVRQAIRKAIQACFDRSLSDYAQGRESTQLRKDFVRENIVLPLRTIAPHLNFVCKGDTAELLPTLPTSTTEHEVNRSNITAQQPFMDDIQLPSSGENKAKQRMHHVVGSHNDGSQNNVAQNDGSYNRQYHAQVMVFGNRHE